jgi:hypothetical protein
MRVPWLSFLVLASLATACRLKSVPQPDSGDEDSSTDTGSTGDTDETDDDTDETDDDTDTGAEDTTRVSFDITGDWMGSALTLSHVHLAKDALLLGETLLEATVTGNPFALDLPDPDPSLLGPIVPEVPEMLGAFFAVSLFEDDGDAVREEGELVIGASPSLLVWAQDVPLELTPLLQDGWNVLAIPPGGGDPLPGDIAHVLVRGRTNFITASGSLAAGSPPGLSIFLLPWAWFDGSSSAVPLLDAPLELDAAETWHIVLDAPPPENHLLLTEGWGGGMLGAEFPAAYVDLPPALYSGEPLPLGACHEGIPMALFYTPGVPDPTLALQLAFMGVGSGWFGMEIEEGTDGPRVLDEVELNGLELSPACALGPG